MPIYFEKRVEQCINMLSPTVTVPVDSCSNVLVKYIPMIKYISAAVKSCILCVLNILKVTMDTYATKILILLIQH